METYILLNETYDNDVIEFEVNDNEDPYPKALELLGWSLTISKSLEDGEDL
jgi:hypothetical protein